MIELRDVTLIGVDCKNVDKTIMSLCYSKKWVKFGDVILVTDVNSLSEFHTSIESLNRIGIRVIHHVSGDRADHEYSVMEHLPEWFTTEHCLFSEWDGFVANPWAWIGEFLRYDYIGAPWPVGAREELWWVSHERPIQPANAAPECEQWTSVGNGGFSLRSHRFCQEVAKRVDRRNNHQICSDAWMVRTLRPVWNKIGITFAPPSLAAVFSCEDRIYSGQFGVHGDATLKLNGWDLRFAGWNINPV
jgi:hypothetical protein